MTLGVRLALLVFVAAAPIFAYEINAEFQHRDERRQQAIGEVRQLATLIAANESRFVDAAYYLLAAVARLDAVINREPDRCAAQLAAMRGHLPDLTGVAAYDLNGWSFCSSTPGAPSIYIGDRPYFREMLRTRSFASSGFIVGRATGRGSLVFVLPVLDEANEMRAGVLVAFSTDGLSRALREILLPEGAVVRLLDADGTVVASSHDEHRWVGYELASEPLVKRLLAERQGVVEGAGLDGIDRIVGFAPVREPARLFVAVGLPRAQIFAAADQRFVGQIAFLVGIVLMVATFAYGFAEFGVRRPIRGLEAAVARFVRGETARVEPPATGIKELVRLSRHLENMSAELHARETALKDALAAKELLLREVNHRVKNSLQLISSLTSLQRAGIKDPEAKRQFAAAAQRIAMVGRVHQRLYHTDDIDRVEFGHYLRELCDDLATSLVEHPDQKLVCEVEDVQLPTDQVVPLALVVNELVTNAFKHALEGRGGRIVVSCRRVGGESLEIAVKDDGPGMDGNADAQPGGGLGLRLIEALTRQLGGRLDVNSSEHGTRFSITFPRTEDAARADR